MKRALFSVVFALALTLIISKENGKLCRTDKDCNVDQCCAKTMAKPMNVPMDIDIRKCKNLTEEGKECELKPTEPPYHCPCAEGMACKSVIPDGLNFVVKGRSVCRLEPSEPEPEKASSDSESAKEIPEGEPEDIPEGGDSETEPEKESSNSELAKESSGTEIETVPSGEDSEQEPGEVPSELEPAE